MIARVFLILSATIALCFAALVPASAQTAPSTHSAAFHAALDIWLNDNDRDSLPEMARLATEGDEDARRFLTLLLSRPDLWTGWLHTPSKSERDRLFRPLAPEGSEGGGWWPQGAEPGWARLLQSEPLESGYVGDMLSLMTAGEERLAFARLSEALQYKPLTETAEVGRASRLSDGLAFFRMLDAFIRNPDTAYPAPSDTARGRMQEALFYSWALFLMVEGDHGHVLPVAAMRDLIGKLHERAADLPHITSGVALADPIAAGKSAWPTRRRHTLDWLTSADDARHYRRFCQQSCGDSYDRCLLSAYYANGGYAVLFGRQSPSQRLIPDKIFRESRRARRLPARRVAFEMIIANEDPETRLAELRQGSTCFAREVGEALSELPEKVGK